jgi:Glycosyl transferases group 1
VAGHRRRLGFHPGADTAAGADDPGRDHNPPLLASSLEGLPLSVLEAQACRTPVVAYPSAGIPEIIRDGETGLLVRQDDFLQLSACIARVLTDAGLRVHLVGAAQAQVVTGFTLEQQADRHHRLMAELIAGGGDNHRRRSGPMARQGLTE